MTRTASILSFAFGLLLCVPLLTQVLGVCFGLYALGRRRLPNERLAMAWIGIAISFVGVLGWFIAGNAVTMFVTAPRAFVMPPYAGSSGFADSETTGTLSDQMLRVHRATEAYHRDFREWPTSVNVLMGPYLPPGFTVSTRLTYRSVAAPGVMFETWVLMVSDDLFYGLDERQLDTPHRLVLRLSGKVELLPASQVDELLASPSAEPTEEPNQAFTGDGG